MHQVKYEKCEKEVVGMISGILLLCNSVCGGVQCVCATGLIMHGSTICAVSTFLFSLGCSICAEYHLHLIKVGFLDDALGLLCCRYTKGQICQKYKKNLKHDCHRYGLCIEQQLSSFFDENIPSLKTYFARQQTPESNV